MRYPNPDDYRDLETVVREFLEGREVLGQKMLGLNTGVSCLAWTPDFYAVRNELWNLGRRQGSAFEYANFAIAKKHRWRLDEKTLTAGGLRTCYSDLVIDGVDLGDRGAKVAE